MITDVLFGILIILWFTIACLSFYKLIIVESKSSYKEKLDFKLKTLIEELDDNRRKLFDFSIEQSQLKGKTKELEHKLIMIRFDSIKLTDFKTELYKKLFLEYRANGVDYKEMNEYILIPTDLVYKLEPFYRKYCELLQAEKDYLLVKKQEKELKAKRNK